MLNRRAFLDGPCAGGTWLRREVESLIDSHKAAGRFIERPAYQRIAGLLGDEGAGDFAGRTLKHYRVVRPLGAGEVYLAEDTRLGRKRSSFMES